MSTATQNGNHSTALTEWENKKVAYKPFAESEAIEISVGMVKNVLATRSRSGREPGSADIMKFMMLCKSRALNPFVGDAYLLGYDERDRDTTNWSLITAIQALRKRAEAHPKYDGMQSGVILLGEDGKAIEREGGLILDGDNLVGGWAVCYRKDRKIPARATVKFSVYDTGRSRWKKDPGGMITKVAEAAALRQAFPSDLAGLYIRDEFGGEVEDRSTVIEATQAQAIPRDLNELAARLSPPPSHADDDEPHLDASESQDDPDYSEGEASPEELAAMDKSKGKKSDLFDKAPNAGQ